MKRKHSTAEIPGGNPPKPKKPNAQLELSQGNNLSTSLPTSTSVSLKASGCSSTYQPPASSMDRHFNENIIVHLFLPKQTPEKAEEDLHQIEEDMLTHVTESFRKFKEDIKLDPLTPVQDMLDKWVQVQPKSPVEPNSISVIRSALGGLELGHTIPIYIRNQNCTMMISKIVINGEVKVRVQTFRTSLPSQTVTSNVNSLKMQFPETSNIIENEGMLSSNIFASHICEMAVEDFSVQLNWRRLEYLKYGSKIKAVPTPFSVSDWAVGNLVPRDDPTGKSITKKIRDQVTIARISTEPLLPFRRSGMWMSIKVALHLKLLEVFAGDEDTSQLVYKMVILHVLVNACKFYKLEKDRIDRLWSNIFSFDLDLASQMVAKIGRRVWKLERLSSGRPEVELMKSTVLEHTLQVLTLLKETMQGLWCRVSLPSGPRSFQLFNRSNENLRKDFVHKIKPLDEFVTKVRKLARKPQNFTNGRSDMEMEIISSKSIASLKKLNSENQTLIWLHDTERFIKEIVNENQFSSLDIFNLGQRYISRAEKAYRNKPLGLSQYLLVTLKLACILDKIATKQHPLLLEFKPDIKSSSFDCLLLPHRPDINLLNEIQVYFNTRDRNGSRSILESDVDGNTFSVRYAEQCEKMERLRNEIECHIQRATKDKLDEVERTREECRDLERKINAGSCTCRFENSIKVKDYCSDTCPLKKTLDIKRLSVAAYEIPWPQLVDFQRAISFEFLIPKKILHLRLLLAKLKYRLLGETTPDGTKDSNLEGRHVWLNYPGLSFVSRSVYATNTIALGSTVPPRKWGNPDLLLATNETFIVKNTMDCKYFYAKYGLCHIYNPLISLPKKCHFDLADTANSLCYMSLQKYVAFTTHSQNDVLANQNDCHQKMCLNEYIAFGSLRAGHRIQLRNLYMAISNRSLSLDKEPVLALILQTIWQVGPSGENGLREAHIDFQVDEFSFEFLDLLGKLIKSNEAKYSTPLVLLTAIVITGRIMELNENCREKCYQLFKEWRVLTKTWSDKIEAKLKAINSINQARKAVMQKILYEIKLCSMMTYNVYGAGQINNVCKDDEAMTHLLYTLNSKNLLARECNPSFSGFMKILIEVEQMIPFRLKLDEQINTMNGQKGFEIFLKEKFPFTSEWTSIKKEKNIIIAECSNSCVAFNVFTGELLINGYPETEMSSQINKDVDFRRFFQKYLNFRIQRMSTRVLRTSDPFHGKHYEFICSGTTIRIIEIQEDHTRKPLANKLTKSQR